MLRVLAVIFGLIALSGTAMSCPVVLEMGLNQSGHKLKEFKEFVYNFEQSGFSTESGDARFKLIFQLLKRKGHAKKSKKFAWGSVSVYDQQGKLMAYSFKKGPSSSKELKAYSSENFDRLMNDLLGELPACF
jgi:hypothetical protein